MFKINQLLNVFLFLYITMYIIISGVGYPPMDIGNAVNLFLDIIDTLAREMLHYVKAYFIFSD